MARVVKDRKGIHEIIIHVYTTVSLTKTKKGTEIMDENIPAKLKIK